LTLHATQVDHDPFPVHTLELKNPKVLIRSNQAEKIKGKNLIVGEERSEFLEKGEKASLKKTPGVSLKDSMLGGQRRGKGVSSAPTDLASSATGLTSPTKYSEHKTKSKNKKKVEF
jgi:hypothetical protein